MLISNKYMYLLPAGLEYILPLGLYSRAYLQLLGAGD